jgi:hypothetical protein
MIFSRDNDLHEPHETANRICGHANQATQFLLDTNEGLEKHINPRNSFKTNNSRDLYSIQKRNSARYKPTLRRAIQVSMYNPAYAIFNCQPSRLETRITHTKQTTAPHFNRQLSRTSGPANLTQSSLPSDLTFDDRNPRA